MAKTTCEASCPLRISLLKRQGCFEPSASRVTATWTSSLTGRVKSVSIVPRIDGETPYALLQYAKTQSNGTKIDFEYPVSLVTTPCFFGGSRFWFSCPLLRDGSRCGRRVGVLYMGERYFGCRECLNLAYESQQETHTEFFKSLSRAFPKPLPTLRVKHWKGRATKRYMRLMRREQAPRPQRLGEMGDHFFDRHKSTFVI